MTNNLAVRSYQLIRNALKLFITLTKDASIYLKIKKGAYYLNGSCVAYHIGREKTFSVLGHEGWHQFNSRHFNYRLPSWLDEGIALLFEKSKYNDGWFHFQPDKNINRLAALKKIMIENKMIPLQELILEVDQH